MQSVTWSAPEFHYYEKGGKWFVWSIIIAAIIAVTGFFLANLLFVIFIVIAEVIVLMLGNQEPRTLTHTLSDQGFQTEGRSVVSYAELSGYAVVPEQHFPELVLRTRQTLGGYIKVFVPVDKIGAVQGAVTQHLKPFQYDQSLAEHVARLLRF